MASEHFTAFLAGLDAPAGGTDEFPNTDAFFLLGDAERVAAEDILITRLAVDDRRAARALADIRCLRAVPALAERAMWSPSAPMREIAVWAMTELGVDRGLPALLGRLRDGDVDARLQAVVDLGGHRDRESQNALETAAFTDPEPVVRGAALDTLFARLDLLMDAEPFHSMLDFVRRRVLSPLPSVRAEAEVELRELFAKWAAGRPRRELGLVWRADSEEGPLGDFVRGIYGESQFDYTLLAGLSDQDRKWVEDVLLSELHHDPDAVRAVAILGIRRAVQPLRELLPVTEHVPAADIELALRQLGA
jgi:HEAT repeat protein